MRIFLVGIMLLIVNGCTGLPEGVTPVAGFDVNKYMGKWYEIARLDHSFERGMDKVTAEYSLRDDGGVKVINRGFSIDNNRWQEVEGTARFVKGENEAYLKVSFFGPFYGTYAVFELDKENYQYAFVSGPDTSYLWLLARTPSVSEEVIKRFVEKSKALGFETEDLIFVSQEKMTKFIEPTMNMNYTYNRFKF